MARGGVVRGAGACTNTYNVRRNNIKWWSAACCKCDICVFVAPPAPVPVTATATATPTVTPRSPTLLLSHSLLRSLCCASLCKACKRKLAGDASREAKTQAPSVSSTAFAFPSALPLCLGLPSPSASSSISLLFPLPLPQGWRATFSQI